MKSLFNEPLVLHLINRKRGERGYRTLQGESLRRTLLQLIATQEQILHGVSQLVERSRRRFPRLYLLSDEELVGLLAISRNPKAFLPYARTRFPGLVDLTYALPPDVAGMNSALDYELNGACIRKLVSQ